MEINLPKENDVEPIISVKYVLNKCVDEFKLTQISLASILSASQSQVSKWMTGKVEPNLLRKEDIIRRIDEYSKSVR